MQTGARHEWRRYWTLPIAAALGNSASILHVYSLGPFMEPLHEEFGWNRAQVSLGITIANGLGALLNVAVGMLIDRWGPRPVGLIGVVIMCGAFALLSTATGSMSNWIMLWMLLAVGTSWVQPTIWTSAVASRFDKSRGLAIAITICGSGVAATIIPPLAAWTIEHYGWRAGFAGLGTLWLVVLLPFLILFFRGEQDALRADRASGKQSVAASLPGLTLAEGLRSASFYRLAIAGMLFSFAVIGVIVHFVPILHDRGLDPIGAAGIAGLVGISSVVGRFGTGFLLDRFPAKRVAMVALLLPCVAGSLLLSGGGTVALAAAALVIGLSLGSELDVILYLATRHFGLKRFGALFGTMLIALALGTALGPVSAGASFDHFDTYTHFILLTFPLVIVSAVLLGTLQAYPDHSRSAQPAAA